MQAKCKPRTPDELQPDAQGSAATQQLSFYDSGLGGLTPLPGAVYLNASLPRPGSDGVQRLGLLALPKPQRPPASTIRLTPESPAPVLC